MRQTSRRSGARGVACRFVRIKPGILPRLEEYLGREKLRHPAVIVSGRLPESLVHAALSRCEREPLLFEIASIERDDLRPLRQTLARDVGDPHLVGCFR